MPDPTATGRTFTERSGGSGEIASLLCGLFLHRWNENVSADDSEYKRGDLSCV